MGEMALLIILRDRRELIIRLDNVYYFTRGSKFGLRKSTQKLRKYQETDPIVKHVDPRHLVEVIVKRSNFPTDDSRTVIG